MLRLLRSLWRFRDELARHQRAWLVEVATAVHTLLESNIVGRAGLRLYRVAMGLLLALAGSLLLVGLLVGASLREHVPALVVAAVLLAAAAVVGWLWFTWSTGLRILDEYADEARQLPLAELPARLRQLAGEGRDLAGVPPALLRDLLSIQEPLEGTAVAQQAPSGAEPHPGS